MDAPGVCVVLAPTPPGIGTMRLAVAILTTLAAVCTVLRAEPVVFLPPPRLATTVSELEQLRASPQFAAVRDAAMRQAEALLTNPVVIPAGAGDWVFYYANPENGQRLQPKSLGEHVDPTTGKVFRDARTVAAYRTILHDQVNDAALQCGWAYAYTGDERFASEVRRLLLQLADDYHTYPGRHDRWGHKGILAPLGGRRYAQSLDEAYGVIKLAKAYDLTRTARVWTEPDRRHAEDDFFRPTSDTLLRFNQGINNHQTWYNAGLICIASVLADSNMVARVLHMQGGFYDQLDRSVGSDGLWYEGTMAYHRYALSAMLEIADAGRRMGLHLHEQPRLLAMIAAPLKVSYPNGQFPAINDSDRCDIGMFREAFRWAYGDDHVPPLETNSVDMHAAGLAILRRGSDTNAICLMLDYGPHGEWHGHCDKLNIVLYANGREWMPDPGRLSYSHKEYKTWVKETAAHNTVVIDGDSQSEATGRLRWFQVTNDYAACAAEVTDAYAQTTLSRTLLLTDQVLVDVLEVVCEKPRPRQIDWLAHVLCDAIDAPAAERAPATLGNHNGYQHLADGTVYAGIRAGEPWTFTAGNAPNGHVLRLWCLDSDSEAVYTANGIGYSIDQRVPALIRRRTANATRFVTVYDLSGRGDFVRGATVSPDGNTISVATRGGGWRVRLGQIGADAVHTALRD